MSAGAGSIIATSPSMASGINRENAGIGTSPWKEKIAMSSHRQGAGRIPSVVTAAAVAAYCVLAVRAADVPLARFEYSERHMGTLVRVTLYAADEATAQKASSAAFRRVKEL